MALKIVQDSCTACGACEVECPNGAIGFTGEEFLIDPLACSECDGQFDQPQCAEICPVPDTCVPA